MHVYFVCNTLFDDGPIEQSKQFLYIIFLFI